MKKLLFLSILFISVNLFAQDNFKLKYYKDIMTEKEYLFSEQRILCVEDAKKGFVVNVSLGINKGVVNYKGISIKSAGIGSCVENDVLIILFEDSTKISLKSWNKFNCEGRSYFDLNGTELNNLTKRIKAIRFQNGRSYESLTVSLEKENDKAFFIDVKQALDKQVYEIVDKM